MSKRISHNHIELVEEISKLLLEAQHPNPKFWETKLELDKVRCNGHGLSLQRIAITRYWHNELLSAPKGTMYERLLLRYTGNDKEFLEFFKRFILPTIICFNLGIK